MTKNENRILIVAVLHYLQVQLPSFGYLNQVASSDSDQFNLVSAYQQCCVRDSLYSMAEYLPDVVSEYKVVL